MPMQQQCVICARPLPIPRRVDARYCRSPSTCRVQAFRANKPGGEAASAFQHKVWRSPAADAPAAGARTRTQLATFRALRQEQKRAAQVAAQRAQADQEELVLARQQMERLAATLQETQALVETQRAAAARAAARWAEERQWASTLAQEQRQAAAQATRSRDAEQQRAAALEQQLARTLTAAREERAQYELELSQEHLLQLCEARATACALADAAQGSAVHVGRSEVAPPLDRLPVEPEQSPDAKAVPSQQRSREPPRLSTRAAELAEAKAFFAEVLEELQPSPTGGGRSPSIAAELSAAGGKLKGAFATIAEVFVPAPTVPSPAPPIAPAQPPSAHGAVGSRRYPRLEKP